MQGSDGHDEWEGFGAGHSGDPSVAHQDAEKEATKGPSGHEYTCHSCGFTQRLTKPPDYCPRCHAETHPESS
jgi:rubrerythrin